MFKQNVIRNHTDMDETSYHFLISMQALEWGDMFYDASRLIYLFFLQSDASDNPKVIDETV